MMVWTWSVPAQAHILEGNSEHHYLSSTPRLMSECLVCSLPCYFEGCGAFNVWGLAGSPKWVIKGGPLMSNQPLVPAGSACVCCCKLHLKLLLSWMEPLSLPSVPSPWWQTKILKPRAKINNKYTQELQSQQKKQVKASEPVEMLSSCHSYL